MQFEWNEDKARLNKRKHGVSFHEALTSFYEPGQVAFYDVEHSEDEDREILLAHSNQGRLLLVVYTLRDDIIRIISARRATRREAQDYARGI
ncbi:MAG: BrnT family toxin [Gammaproteobacteria bacterium]|nr:MAG: BrnT family toxin [Gammaproteobacteria bacterium]RKZ38939.1 MAG: BrnT family toxin [Gammaproteobacteria bacterium]RKZ71492.1 MAG: BrnT family toxin [Gammaproteobacteria bacterium]